MDPRPLRLTETTLAVVADWVGDQDQARRQMADRFLQALRDGSWVTGFRWHQVDVRVVIVRLDPRNPAHMTIYKDGPVEFGEVFTIDTNPLDDELIDSAEALGVDPEPEAGLDDEGRRPPAGPPEVYPEPNEDPDDFARRLRDMDASS